THRKASHHSERWPPTAKKGSAVLAVCSVVALVAALSGGYRGKGGNPSLSRPQALEGHRFPVLAVAFNRAGTSLTTAAGRLGSPRQDTELIVWNVETGGATHSHAEFPLNLTSLALFPDGSALATAAANGSVHLWAAARHPAEGWAGGPRSRRVRRARAAIPPSGPQNRPRRPRQYADSRGRGGEPPVDALQRPRPLRAGSRLRARRKNLGERGHG